MATHSNGISSLQLQRLLALGSYKSAWLLCAKSRQAMVAPPRALLAGIAEVNETEIPLRGKDEPITGGGGRSSQSKMLVADDTGIVSDVGRAWIGCPSIGFDGCALSQVGGETPLVTNIR